MPSREKPKQTTKQKVSRPKPVGVIRAQVAPHIRTLSNGQPRPKSRRK